MSSTTTSKRTRPPTELTSDEVRVLIQARREAERSMYVMQGAIELLAQQQHDSTALCCCAVCAKAFASQEEQHNGWTELENKRAAIEQRRAQNYAAVFDNCSALLLTTSLEASKQYHQASASRLRFYLRSGMLAEFKTQKVACLKDMQCVGCLRAFASAAEFANFLRRVDSIAVNMARELHLANNNNHHNINININNTFRSVSPTPGGSMAPPPVSPAISPKRHCAST